MMTEDQVSEKAARILGLEDSTSARAGVGQLTTFNALGFKACPNKPDGWYLPKNLHDVALILEVKNSKTDISKQKVVEELLKNVSIANAKYPRVVGVLYNGVDVMAFKNGQKAEVVHSLQNKEYYLSLFNVSHIDKQKIYTIAKRINDSLHFQFGIKNLYHRMIFTACALVAERYHATLKRVKNMGYTTFHTRIHETLAKSFQTAKKQNQKLDLMLETYAEIKMNQTDNQGAINDFIDSVVEISESINSDYWNGEDVMAIFFNEFNRYRGKSESGQVFTPDHITSFMYRLINVTKDDVVLDAACGSGAFLVKSMCNMIKEAGGVATTKAAHIKASQLYGIELDKQIFSLACANMLIHKDGKTNLEQLDSRTEEAARWIRDKGITKVLMNPPFENKYGCMKIVANVLESVPPGTDCAFIMPDKKLEKVKEAKRLLKRHTLSKIIKLPERVFQEGVTTSIFVFKAHVPQGKLPIFACYFADDGLETVKNQGRQDVRNRWQSVEDRWMDVVTKQANDDSIQWFSADEHLSYQTPPKPFVVREEDFVKAVMDYALFMDGVDPKAFAEAVAERVLYMSDIDVDGKKTLITMRRE